MATAVDEDASAAASGAGGAGGAGAGAGAGGGSASATGLDNRHAELLLVMNDAGQGLLSRLGGVKRELSDNSTRPVSLSSSEYSKLRKALEKHFPDTAGLESISGYESFQKSAHTALADFERVVHVMADCASFCDEVLALMKDFLRCVISLQFDSNEALVRPFMDLLVTYIRVHVMMSSIPSREAAFGMYAVANRIIRGDLDPDYDHVAEFMKGVRTPFRTMQQQLKPMSRQVTDLLLGLRHSINECFRVFKSGQHNLFNPLSAVAELGKCETRTLYRDLAHFGRFHQWVVLGFLVCPWDLALGDAMGMLRGMLEEGFVVHIYQDETRLVHVLYETLFDWFPPKDSSVKLVRPKQLVIDAEKVALKDSGLEHRQRMQLFKGAGMQLIKLFDECPGLVAPKLTVALALLSMLQHEIMWWLTHQGQTPRKVGGFLSKSFVGEFDAATFRNPDVIEALGVAAALRRQLEKSTKVVNTYYSAYLRGAHVTALTKLIDAVEGQPFMSNGVKRVLGGIVTRAKAADGSHSLLPLRLNWLRILVNLYSGSNAALVQRAAAQARAINATAGFGQPLKALIHRVNIMYTHSRFVGSLEEVLVDSGPLHHLWWFRGGLEQLFRDTLNGRATVEPRYTIYSLLLWSYALHSAHRLAGEEHFAVGKAAVSAARGGVDTVLDVVEQHLNTLVESSYSLQYQAQAVPSHRRWSKDQARKRSRQKAKDAAAAAGEGAGAGAAEGEADEGEEDDATDTLCPGVESRPEHRSDADMRVLRNAERCLSAIIGGASQVRRFVVFDREFNLEESLRRRVLAWLRKQVRVGAAPRRGVLRAPSIAALQLEVVLAVTFRVTGWGLPVGTKVQEVMEEETSGGELSELGVPQVATTAEMPSGNYAQKMAHAFANFAAGQRGKAVYSPPLSGYVDPKLPSMFASHSELEAVAYSLGPAGVRVVAARLLALVTSQMPIIQAFVVTNKASLELCSKWVSRQTDWRDKVSKLKDLNKFGASLVAIGHALALRRSLHQALADVVARVAPALSSTTALAADLSHANSEPWKSARMIAADGGKVVVQDETLIATLARYCKTKETATAWNVLPAACSCVFLTNIWKSGSYQLSLQGFSSNAHVSLVAVSDLLRAFQPLVVGVLGAQQSAHGSVAADVTEWLKEFVRCSAFHGLRVQQKDSPVKCPWEALLCLEAFVNDHPRLSRKALEQWLPFPVLHAVVVDAASSRSTVAAFVAAARAAARELTKDASVPVSPPPVPASGAGGGAGAGAGAGAGSS